jgi:hypothetical protein
MVAISPGIEFPKKLQQTIRLIFIGFFGQQYHFDLPDAFNPAASE